MATSNTKSQTKSRRFMSLEVWEALQERDREYALNLAIAGPWVDEDNKERDNYGNLDARYGSERCQETALICTISISAITNYLDQNGIQDSGTDLVHQYRVLHKNDKRWMDIYTLEDISTPNPEGYGTLKQRVFGSMDAELVKYLGWSRIINSFTFIARQRNPSQNTSYTMQSKAIPYTFNHIEVSTHAHEQSYWSSMLTKHRSGGPTHKHIFLIGNEAYSTSCQSTADTLIKSGSDTLKIKTLLDLHPQHRAFVRPDHLEKYLRSGKSANAPVLKKKVVSAEENARRAERNREVKARRLEKMGQVKSDGGVVASCRGLAAIHVDTSRVAVV